MSVFTTILNLIKPDSIADANQTFNLKTFLNDNWDKLDTFAAKTITTDRLVNNLAATEAGFGLDSRQGKALGDSINNHVLKNATDSGGVHGFTIETGTWVPIFKGTTTSGSNTYSQQFGRYIKQGKLVTCCFRLEMSVKDSAMNGNIVIGGLPYTALNTNANRAGLVISNFANITLASGHSQLCGEIIPGDSNISLIAVGSNTYGVNITAADVSLAIIHGSITYESSV